MKPLNVLFAGCLVSLLLTSSMAFAQCQSKVTLTEKINCSPGQSDGQIEISVGSKGTYELTLVEYNSQQEHNLEVISGAGTKSYTFKKLKGEFLYRVVVVFHEEAKFLCKNRVVTNIVLTDGE